MITVHIEKQREYHILPCSEKLAESEIDCIAHALGLENYEVIEHKNFKVVNLSFQQDYFSYVFKY